jgi:hypothetical protein
MQLAFGYSRGVPEDVTTAWGARLIAPNDLVHDRQDLVAETDEAKRELIAWLNGGAIKAALTNLREQRYDLIYREGEFTVYEDNRGVIVGNTQQSGGYVYVSGWLKLDADPTRYEVVRGPIPAERWHTKYGWDAKRSAEMDGTGDDVRIYAVRGGERRELLPDDRHGEFEFGYGGSGPHASARAIVADRTDASEMSPASAREAVPELFVPGERGYATLTVYAADVDARLQSAALRAIRRSTEIGRMHDDLASEPDVPAGYALAPPRQLAESTLKREPERWRKEALTFPEEWGRWGEGHTTSNVAHACHDRGLIQIAVPLKKGKPYLYRRKPR